jgi:hypothetical protein
MNKKKLLFFGFCLVFILIAINFAQAFIAPSVYINEFNLNSPNTYFAEGDTLSGNFIIWNSEDYVIPDIIYKLNLIKDESSSMEKIIIDEKIFNETLVLYPDGKLNVTFNYSLPANLMSGAYKFRVELTTKKGIPLGWEDIPVNVQSSDNFLYIKEAKILKNNSEEHPTVGIGFEKNETVEIKFVTENPSANSIAAQCQIIIYERMTNMLEVSNVKKETIVFAPGEKKNIQYKMPIFEKPESYLAEIKFYSDENEIVSNALYFRWVVQGASAEILSIKTDESSYSEGEKAEVQIDFVGAADTITPVGDGKVEVKIYNEENEIIGKASKNLNIDENDSVVFQIPIEKDANQPRIEAAIVKGDAILDNYKTNVNSVLDFSVKKKKSNLPFYFLLILIFGLISFLIYKKRNQNKPLWILFFVFIIFGTFFTNINFSQAAKEVYSQACNPSYIGITWNNPIKERAFVPGEPITFSGKVYVPACMDALLNNTIRFYITTEPAPPRPIIRNECVESEESRDIRESILTAGKTVELGQIFHPGEAILGPIEYEKTFNFPFGFYGKVYAMVYFDGYHWGWETNHYQIIAKEEIFTIPSPPIGLSYNSPFCKTINLSWNPNPICEEVDEYKIFRNGTDITPYEYSGTHFSDFGLLPETTYSYFVKAHNRAGWSKPSDVLLAKTIPCSLNLVVLNYNCDIVVLGWDKILGAAYYKLYRTTDPSNYGEPIYTGLATTYEDKMHFESDVTYYYKVEVYDINDNLGTYDEIDLVPCSPLPDWKEVHPKW